MRSLCIAILVLGGCASLNTHLPEIDPGLVDAEQVRQESVAFEEMAALQDRFYQVADRVLAANTELCEKTRPDIGAVTWSLKEFSKKLRPAAERELGLTDVPHIIYVRPGSPSARAGLQVGDQLLLDGDDPVSIRSSVFEGALNAGQAVTLVRGETSRAVTFEPEMRCDYQLSLKMSSAINAYATGKTIVMTAGMMNFVDTDDELAYVIGHELAHNTQGHIRKTLTNLLLSGFATRYTRPFESEADYVGLYYMVRAGYDPDGIEDLWRRLARQSLKPVYKAKTHPTFPNRAIRIAAARAEIQAKQEQGEVLIPNYKSDEAGS